MRENSNTTAWNRISGIHAVRLANTDELNEEQWLEIRRTGIGGSDIAAIAGINPWKSPFSVYWDKIEGAVQEVNEKMRWGQVLEDAIAREYALREDLNINRVRAVLQHPENPIAIGNIDRLVIVPNGENRILEIKNVGEFQRKKWEFGQIPEIYVLQVQWYLYVTGLRHATIAALIGGQELVSHEIERNDSIIDSCVHIAREFWTMVENRTPPDPDGSDSSREILSVMYPEATPRKEIVLPETAEELILEVQSCKDTIGHIEDQKSTAENKLRAMMGDAEIGRTRDWLVKWTNTSSERIDSKRLRKEQPAIASEYLKTVNSRRFTIESV
ncbi:MAG TPA: YqaJ viral recombinase family protein [Bacteroidota bacterium]|nr:YqaJ viral recombinase family protein [Bacteroidota bacterium]